MILFADTGAGTPMQGISPCILRVLIAVIALLACGSPSFAKDNCPISSDGYALASGKERHALLERTVQKGDDACLPQLEKLLAVSSKGPHADYEDVLSAIARVGTENAATLLNSEVYEKRKIDSRLAINALARMGRTGLKHLTAISEKKELAFSKALMPFISPTSEAVKAREAVALINDPAAAGDLAPLLNTWVRPFAWKALSAIKAPGYEAQAMAVWQDRWAGREDRGYALRYLLSVDRLRHLPLLQKELKTFDAEVSRLVRDNKELRARKVMTWLNDQEYLLLALLYLGGDAESVPSLAAFADSRIWDRQYQERVRQREIFLAVLGLGLSHAPDAKPPLLRLLREDFLIDSRIDGLDRLIRDEHPSWPQLRQYERGHRGFPLSAAVAVALGELGDRSVIPALREAAGRNPDIQGVFESAIAMLRRCARENEMCGGIAGIPCCPGLACEYDGSYPDAGGVCRTFPDPREAIVLKFDPPLTSEQRLIVPNTISVETSRKPVNVELYAGPTGTGVPGLEKLIETNSKPAGSETAGLYRFVFHIKNCDQVSSRFIARVYWFGGKVSDQVSEPLYCK